MTYVALVAAFLALAVALSTALQLSRHNRTLAKALMKSLGAAQSAPLASFESQSSGPAEPLVVQLQALEEEKPVEDVDEGEAEPYILTDEYEAEMEEDLIKQGRAVPYA